MRKVNAHEIAGKLMMSVIDVDKVLCAADAARGVKRVIIDPVRIGLPATTKSEVVMLNQIYELAAKCGISAALSADPSEARFLANERALRESDAGGVTQGILDPVGELS